MKRFIIILVLFALMMTAAGLELKHTTKFFSNQYDVLNECLTEFDKDPENLDRADTIAAAQKALDHWEGGKKLIMMLTNHNVIKLVDEKMVSIIELCHQNQRSDAYVALKCAMAYIKDLKTENHPIITNLL